MRRPAPGSLSASERACEIARAGRYSSVTKLRRQLQQEGYSNLDELLDGAGFRKVLKKLSLDARRSRGGTARGTEPGQSRPSQV